MHRLLGWRTNPDWVGFVERRPEPEACDWQIGLARWPRNRLFGLEADAEGCIWLDLGEISEPCELRLNYSSTPSGRIGVRLASWIPLSAEDEIEGRSASDALPLGGDSLEETVTWNDGSVIQPPENGRRLTAYIELDRATLYAYDLQPVATS